MVCELYLNKARGCCFFIFSLVLKAIFFKTMREREKKVSKQDKKYCE